MDSAYSSQLAVIMQMHLYSITTIQAKQYSERHKL